MLSASRTSIICWIGCAFYIEYLQLLCQNSSDHMCEGSFLDVQFCYSDQPAYLCTSTMWFLKQLPCNIAWGQGWWFPQTFSCCWGWNSIFYVSRYSRWICTFLFPTLWRIGLEFWLGLHWICRLLLVRWSFLKCWSLQSMSMGDLSIFWDLPQFPYLEVWSSCHTGPSLA